MIRPWMLKWLVSRLTRSTSAESGRRRSSKLMTLKINSKLGIWFSLKSVNLLVRRKLFSLFRFPRGQPSSRKRWRHRTLESRWNLILLRKFRVRRFVDFCLSLYCLRFDYWKLSWFNVGWISYEGLCYFV